MKEKKLRYQIDVAYERDEEILIKKQTSIYI